MVYTIILDSSNTDLSIGIAKEGILIDYISYAAWQQQSEFMIKELDTLLNKYEVKNSDIKDIMVSIGPGSYTGVRISLTIAKTIAFALSIPVYAVSSLHIQKRGNSHSNVVLKDTIMTNDEVKQYILDHPDYAICGDTKYLGIEGYKANVLAEALSIKSSLEKVEDPLLIKPVYLKD